MKKTLICCAALAAAFSLLLCACGTPAGPAVATTTADLSAFVTAFDLSDLSQYLTGPQLADLEAAVRETLISRGHAPESFTLQFDDPAEDSLKLPFDNAGGLDLARLDTAKLAGYIADQMETVLGVPGTAPAASAVATTTTTTTAKLVIATVAPTTLKATTTNAPTTAKPATTKSKQQMHPQELRLASNQTKNASNYSNIDSNHFSEYADSGFNYTITANGKTYMISRDASYHQSNYLNNQFKAGAKETIGIYLKTGQVGGEDIFQKIGTKTFTVDTYGGSSPPGYKICIVPNSNDTMQFPGDATPSHRTILINVGNNIGLNNSYSIENDYFVNLQHSQFSENTIKLYELS